VKLSIVIPTLGRPSLAATLASCADADEIVVVLDTSRGGALPCKLPPNSVFAEGDFGVTGGHAGRAHGISLATGTHLAFFDDDDVYTPGAMDLMRYAACDRPVIFRMDHYTHGVLWRDREVRFGNVSTQMYLVPNDPARLGTWEPHAPGLREPGGDYTFIKGCVEKMGEPVWREEITSILRPHDRGPSVAVVTPWLDHPELADDYLQAVSYRRADDELLVVDNASKPRLEFAAICARSNLGFCAASNVGLYAAETDAVLFLNNDVAATRGDWLARIRAALEPGVLAGAMLRYDAHGDVDGHRLPYLDGWCLAGMRADLLDLGGFDQEYVEPAYYSDNDLCLRARAAGMTLREVKVGLRHKVGQTAGPADDPLKLAAVAANQPRFLARARELLEGVAA
jgi:glycosyltransferase involved in cell wall biosynthesis